MIYLKSFKLLDENEEYSMIVYKMNIHNNLYPLKIFPNKKFINIDFEPITIFYGGNGSGKTTILNIISDSINASKRNIDKKGDLFDNYVERCSQYCNLIHKSECKEIKYISSDDVFDYLLDIKAINSDVNRRKYDLINEYYEYKNTPFQYNSLEQYEELKNRVDSNRMTVSKYVRTKLRNIINGGIVEKTFRPTEKCPTAHIDRREMQYLYSDEDFYHFMDVETYDQIDLTRDSVGEALKFVKENEMVKVCSHKGNVFAVEPPLFVELKIETYY